MAGHRVHRGVVLGVALLLAGAGFAEQPKAAAKVAPSKRHRANEAVEVAKKHGTVNLNGASKAELMKLPRITATLADRIIVGRPYESKFQLLTRSVLPRDVFEAVRMRIEVRQTGKRP